MRRIAITAALAVVGLLSSVQADARVHHHTYARSYYGPNSGRHYTNVDGHSVHSPVVSNHRHMVQRRIAVMALGVSVSTRVAHVRIMAASRAGEGSALIDHE